MLRLDAKLSTTTISNTEDCLVREQDTEVFYTCTHIDYLLVKWVGDSLLVQIRRQSQSLTVEFRFLTHHTEFAAQSQSLWSEIERNLG